MFDKITDRLLKQQLTQQAQQYMLDYKKNNNFPQGNVPLGFSFLLNKAFKYIAPPSLQMEVPAYIALRAIVNNNYSLLDFGTILYVLQNSRQVDLEMNNDEYTKFLNNLQGLMVKWTEIVNTEEVNIADAMEKAELLNQDKARLEKSGEYKAGKEAMAEA